MVTSVTAIPRASPPPTHSVFSLRLLLLLALSPALTPQFSSPGKIAQLSFVLWIALSLFWFLVKV